MKVVLLKPVLSIGNAGQVCEVKEGFAKNYLLPKGLAVVYGDNRGSKVLERLNRIKREQLEGISKINQVISQINGGEIEISAKVNQKKQLFASVNQEEIKNIVEKKYSLRPDSLSGFPIKSLGKHEIGLIFSGDNSAKIYLIVSEK